jgi:hypothetical protein
MACPCNKPTGGCGCNGTPELGLGSGIALAGGISLIGLLIAWILSGEPAGVELGTDIRKFR